MDTTSELQTIEIFKKTTPVAAVEQISESARLARAYLNRPDLSPEEVRKNSENLRQIERSFAQIISVARTTSYEAAPDSLEREARRRFYNFFHENPNAQKESYIAFCIQAVSLKRFVLDCAGALNEIQSALSVFDRNSNFYQTLRQQYIKGILNLLDRFNVLVKRMYRIADFRTDPVGKTDFSDAVSFHPDVEYRISTVFLNELDDYMEKKSGGKATGTDLVSAEGLLLELESSGRAKEEIASLYGPEHPQAETEQTPAGDQGSMKGTLFDASGAYPWNSSVYYFLNYDPKALQNELDLFDQVFYMDTYLGAQNDTIRSELVRAYTRKDKFFERNEAIEKYRSFLVSLFQLTGDLCTLNFRVPEDKKPLFLFHLGPSTFFQLNRNYLMDLQTGTVHRLANLKSRVVKKFIPVEMIKRRLMDWWEENVLSEVSIEVRNDLSRFKELTVLVRANVSRLEKSYRENSRGLTFLEFVEQELGPMNTMLVKRYMNIVRVAGLK